MNPDWEHRLYDETDASDFIAKKYNSHILQCYLSINPRYPAARSDFFRYLLLYAEGGVYLDLKSSISRPLDETLHDDEAYILSRWQNEPGQQFAGWGLHRELSHFQRGEYQTWFIVAARGHPYLRAVISRVYSNILHYNAFVDGVGKLGVLGTTGPIAYSLAIEAIKSDYPFREISNENDIGFVWTIFDDPTGHRLILPAKHYSLLTVPVVSHGPLVDATISSCFHARNSIVRNVSSLFYSIKSIVYDLIKWLIRYKK